ncbi:MAG: nicotinate (nicotinamide) nucleotide adenylyltransferase [Treponema sp.]|jgi:nicotinate-nucleotide adenylyltransferase|nr:nicotinate (nicotinamide) nucleotide adenylyltransferase [Treponema sp.]
MKLAILGGSFNPVHVGHLYLADTVLAAYDYDRVILVPTYQSPFKFGASGGSPAERMDMLAASIAGDSRLAIDDCELRRKGISYTVDTIADIVRRYRPTGKPALVLGDDLVQDFHKWRGADDIVKNADIIIARRLLSADMVFPYPYTQLHNEVMNISSAEIRERILNNGNWRYLVPHGARMIIEDRGLYRFPPRAYEDSPTLALLVRVEEAARSLISQSRFTHSRAVALLCSDLCRRFGLDPRKGYLAGISHDICKSLPEQELIDMAERDGGGISKLEQKKPSLLHARAAAVLLAERFGVAPATPLSQTSPETAPATFPADVLEAVRLHIGGGMGMGSLAKILFIADKIEVTREGIDPALRDLSETGSLDQLFTAVLDNNVAYLRSRQVDISEGTLRLLDAMHKKDSL